MSQDRLLTVVAVAVLAGSLFVGGTRTAAQGPGNQAPGPLNGVQQQLADLQARVAALEALLSKTAADLSARITTLENGAPGAAAGPVVVNGLGNTIGIYVPQDRFLYFNGTEWFYVGPLTADGFAPTAGVTFWYTQEGCQGPAYVSVLSDYPLARFTNVVNGVAYYGTGAQLTLTMRSLRQGPSGACSGASRVSPFALVESFDASVFGPPPFTVR